VTTTLACNTAGNRTQIGGSWARTGLPSAVSAMTYNAANQLTNWNGSALTYDDNGNLTDDGTNTYTWNARNQLASMTGASFVYDPLGRRVSKTISGNTTSYLYDGQNPVQEGSANLLTGLGIDEYFMRTDSAGERSLLTDALGSTLALTDSAGAVQTEYTYEPFGKTTFTGAPSGNTFQYTGWENDGPGLYYYRARYYSPTLQRYISEDPLHSPSRQNILSKCHGDYAPNVSWYLDVDSGMALLMMFRFYGVANSFAVAPQQIPLYTYVADNPVNRFDPMGLYAAPQTPGCDPGNWGFNRCATKCCNEHDECYKRAYFSYCSQATHIEPFLHNGGTRIECWECNNAVYRCLARATWHWGSRRKDPC
jgi:RHS repeat-associated protein